MIKLNVVREEFGFRRTECACKKCQIWCQTQPGYLVPSDLQRLIPADADPLQWAEVHIRASPGVRIQVGGTVLLSIPSLVPAKQETGACHWYGEGKCAVHADSPYGCAFLDQHFSVKAAETRNDAGREARAEAFYKASLYARIWEHLWKKGLRHLTTTEDRKKALVAISRIDRCEDKQKVREQRKRKKKQRRR